MKKIDGNGRLMSVLLATCKINKSIALTHFDISNIYMYNYLTHFNTETKCRVAIFIETLFYICRTFHSILYNIDSFETLKSSPPESCCLTNVTSFFNFTL